MRTARLLFAFGAVAIGAALAAGCSDNTSSVTTSGSCDELTKADNQEFCQSMAATCSEPPPGSKVDVCGIPLREPPAELARSSGLKEFAGSGPPQVECFAPASYPAPPGASQTVKVSGVAKIFSHGTQSSNLTIELYTVKRTGGADDGMPDKLVGTAVTTDADCTQNGVHTVVGDSNNSIDRYECRYTYDGVPTETELLVKTYGGDAWAQLYDYNIYIPNAEVQNGAWTHDVRALAADDYSVIPQAAMGAAITAGHGALAGEVHDCGDVRVSNAIVDIDQPKKILTYFTANEDQPLPDQGAKATSILGLYAALDVKPGPVKIAATGLANGKTVTLGFFTAQVFPDAVTAVTFRGMRPFQLPAK